MRTLKNGGFNRMVENFGLLIQIINDLGVAYNPIKENLKATHLMALHQEAKKALKEAELAANELERSISLRRDELNRLNQFATALLREAKVCGIRGEILQDLKICLRQIRGIKAAPAKPTNPTDNEGAEENKSGGVHYTIERKLDTFKKMVAILEKTPAYESNHPEFNLSSLKAKTAALSVMQKDYNNKLIHLEVCRAQRNKLIHSDLISIAYFGKLAKDYLKNHFRNSKSELNTLKSIKFQSVITS